MMSTNTKRKQASILRSTASEDKQESRVSRQARDKTSSPPMGYAHRSQRSAPDVLSQNLQSKGFGGGVPLNTETAAVKPRVGIE
jgi:hypothetical protein